MINFSHEQHQIVEGFVQNKTALVTGAAGAAAALTPPEQMASVAGNWLQINGIGVLSYAEIISVIGATWVLCLILDRLFVGGRQLMTKIRGTK